MSRIGVRTSSALREAIERVGEVSDAARAVWIVGLAATGHNVDALLDEAGATLEGVTDPAIRDFLRRLVFNISSTHVEQALNTAASGGDEAPLMTVRELLGDDPFDVGHEI